MIVEGLVAIFLNILRTAFQGFEAVGLPLQAINALQTIIVYGIWIVGADIVALFVTSVVFWWTTKFSVGLVVWIWDKLPLT